MRVRRRRTRRRPQPRPARRAGMGLDRFDDRSLGPRERPDALTPSPASSEESRFAKQGKCMSRMLDAVSRLLPRRASGHVRPARGGSRAVGPLIAWDPPGQPVWSPRDYAAFAREGFMQNAIVYRCVRMIAEGAASVPLLLYEGERGDHRARAARSHRSALARPHECRLPRVLVRVPARFRQRLRRGGRRRRSPARAARPAPRPHEGDPRTRRLAGGLRIYGVRQFRSALPRSRPRACARSCTCACSIPSTITTA